MTHSHTNVWKIREFEVKSINKKLRFYDGLKMRLFSESVGFWEVQKWPKNFQFLSKHQIFCYFTIFWFEESENVVVFLERTFLLAKICPFSTKIWRKICSFEKSVLRNDHVCEMLAENVFFWLVFWCDFPKMAGSKHVGDLEVKHSEKFDAKILINYIKYFLRALNCYRHEFWPVFGL